LKEVYEEFTNPTFNPNPHIQFAERRQPTVSKLDDMRIIGLSSDAQSVGVEWGESLTL
jgi:hypothetical protein